MSTCSSSDEPRAAHGTLYDAGLDNIGSCLPWFIEVLDRLEIATLVSNDAADAFVLQLTAAFGTLRAYRPESVKG